MNFASDNTGPAHPDVIAAITAANEGYAMPYGADDAMARVRQSIRDLFEAPEAAVYLVSTGTAANALALSVMVQPWQSIFCHRIAHIEEDECGAPEFYANGAKLALVEGEGGKMTPDGLAQTIAHTGDKGVHGMQRGPVSLTNITEVGTAYSLSEIKALSDVAKSYDLPVHLDGARFANACAALGCRPADMTWKAGVDAVSFGGTKNGCMGVEAVILFDPKKAWEFELRRKRGAHLWSKHRFLSAQMEAYTLDDLWLRLAQSANARMAELRAGLAQIEGVHIAHEPAGNMLFAHLPRAAHKRAFAAGAQYYLFPFNATLEGPEDELILCRLVTDWSCSQSKVQALLDCFKAG